MTTQAPVRSPAQGERVQAPLVTLVPGEHPRRQTDERALDELAASIRSQGVLEPILVRRKGQKLEVLVGNRRTEAARRAGLSEIPAIVVECTDDEAREIALAENLHHVGLDPVDEARFIGEMLRGGRSAAEVAARIGKSHGYVARRERFKDLSKRWQKALEERGKKYEPKKGQSDWQVAEEQDRLELVAQVTAEQLGWIALLSHEEQDGVLDEIRFEGLPSARALRQRVAEGTGSLAAAPWALDDDALVPKAGACTACPNNSANQGQLFEGLESTDGDKGRCLDSQCWASKLAAHVQRRAEAARAEHGKKLVLVRGERGNTDGARIDAERSALTKALGKGAEPLGAHQYTESKKPGKDTIPALVVDGPNAGDVVHIKAQVNRNGVATAKPATKAKAADNRKPAEKKKDALARLESRRMAWAIDRAVQLVKCFDPRLITEPQFENAPTEEEAIEQAQERIHDLLGKPGAFEKLEPERVSKVLAYSARIAAASGTELGAVDDSWLDAKGKPSSGYGEEQPLRIALAESDREIARRLWWRVSAALLKRFNRYGACDPKNEHHRDQRADADTVAELLMGAPPGWLGEQAAIAITPPRWLAQAETKPAERETKGESGETAAAAGAPKGKPKKGAARAQEPAEEPAAAASKGKSKKRAAKK